jgi:hypothetical protein
MGDEVEVIAILNRIIESNVSLSSATKYRNAVSTLQQSFSLYAVLK